MKLVKSIVFLHKEEWENLKILSNMGTGGPVGF